MIALTLLLALAAGPEWSKLVEVIRAPDVGAANKALRQFVAAHPEARGTMRMALVFRALEALPGPAGSFTHRVSAEDCAHLTEVLRKKPTLMPALDCKDVASWQAKLDEGWRSEKPADRRALASTIISAASPARDSLDAMLAVHANPKKYFAELFGLPASEGAKLVAQLSAVRDVLFELLVEADALATQSAGDCEEFLVRYPTHPFAASALFCAGHLDRLRTEFPKHPLASIP
jgi:hypothetical protein